MPAGKQTSPIGEVRIGKEARGGPAPRNLLVTFLQVVNATAESDNNPTWAGTLSVEYESDLPDGSDYVSLMVSAQDGGGAGSASTFADPVSIRA
jgi:hypothetical protein